MTHAHSSRKRVTRIAAVTLIGGLSVGCNALDDDNDFTPPVADPAAPALSQHRPLPYALPTEFVHAAGDATSGREVFRFGTFGNERFWTDAMKLPQGLVRAGVTPLGALRLGLSVDATALHPATAAAAVAAITAIQSGTPPENTIFGDPAVTLALINQNAVIGVVAVDASGNRKPRGSDPGYNVNGSLNLAGGEKVGLSCASCHARTDGSVLPPVPALGTTGSIGAQIDGPSAHDLDVGTILAAADNTLAYYPMLQLAFETLQGGSIGRGDFPGLSITAAQVANPGSIDVAALEQQADRYLTGTSASGQRFYPVGQFDAFPEGVGNPLHIAPFFATATKRSMGHRRRRRVARELQQHSVHGQLRSHERRDAFRARVPRGAGRRGRCRDLR